MSVCLLVLPLAKGWDHIFKYEGCPLLSLSCTAINLVSRSCPRVGGEIAETKRLNCPSTNPRISAPACQVSIRINLFSLFHTLSSYEGILKNAVWKTNSNLKELLSASFFFSSVTLRVPTHSTYPCQSVQWMSGWLRMSDLVIAIASPSFANLFDFFLST